jgi:plastocyanin
MRKTTIIILSVIFLLSIAIMGCSQAPAPTDVSDNTQQPVPQMRQVDEVQKETPVAAEPKQPVAATTKNGTGTIGNAITGNPDTGVVNTTEENVEGAAEEIKLLPDKTMSINKMTVSVGTKLSWRNTDSWPHQMSVISGKGLDTILHGRSERLQQNGLWEFTFNEKGKFVVKDTFSGDMRMNVTVE